MTKTLIYARVSTEDQLEKYGIPVQLRECRRFAQERKLDIVETVTDDGISGVILERPGLDRVRQMAADGLIDVVLMVDVDRLSRELAHLLILKPEIERKARLEFVNATFENSPSGRLFFGVRGVIAQYERELTRERTMRGKKERARAGLVVGGRIAYGYRYEAGKLSADEVRAPIVRDLFSWYDSGLSMRSIALRLRSTGAPTARGRKWGHSSVRRILENETYAGTAHYGTHRREGKLLKLRAPAERIAIPVPALISRDEWERVQAKLAEGAMRGVVSTRNYLLRGLLRCAHCGRRMSGEQNRRYVSYRCNGRDALRHHATEACHTAVNAAKLDRAVWQAVTAAFTDSGFLRRTLSEHQKALESAGPDRSCLLLTQLAKLKRREEACLAGLLDPDLAESRPAIKAQYRQVQGERRRIEQELLNLEENREQVRIAGEWLESTVTVLQEYIPTLTSMEERQGFLRGAVQSAAWDGEQITLACFFGSEMATTSSRCAHFAPSQALQSKPLKITLTARLAA